MDRPLWQIVLALFVMAFVIQRAATGVVLHLGGAAPALAAVQAVQVAAGLAAALGIWLGRPWAPGALLVLGAAVAAAAIFEGFFLGVRPPLFALSEAGVVAVASGGLALLLHRELGGAGVSATGEGRAGAK